MHIETELSANADIKATLTTDHAQSSYGKPILLIHGVAYGPGDLIPFEVVSVADAPFSFRRPFISGYGPNAEIKASWNASVSAARDAEV